MKIFPVLCFLPAVAFCAFCACVEPLPAPEFADTEVTAYAALQLPARNARGLDEPGERFVVTPLSTGFLVDLR